MANRYWRRGTSKFFFAAACSNTSAPTRSEIGAAVDLTPQIAEVTYTHEVGTIATPDWATRFTSTIPGEETGTLGVTAYDLDGTPAADTIRAAMPKNTNGFVFLMPHGDIPTHRMEVWSVRVGAGPVDDYASGTEGARYRVDFALTAVPVTGAVIPA